jgi:hypothetical protein
VTTNQNTTIEKTYALLACTECGAEAYASCNCHKAYKPVDLAAKAIAANPSKSNRAIAAEIGVSEPTVRRARGASPDAPDEHTGLDGKTYPAKHKQAEVTFAAPCDRRKRVFVQPIQPDKPSDIISSLRAAWREVELHANADNKTMLKEAIGNLIMKATRALKAMGGLQ